MDKFQDKYDREVEVEATARMRFKALIPAQPGWWQLCVPENAGPVTMEDIWREPVIAFIYDWRYQMFVAQTPSMAEVTDDEASLEMYHHLNPCLGPDGRVYTFAYGGTSYDSIEDWFKAVTK